MPKDAWEERRELQFKSTLCSLEAKPIETCIGDNIVTPMLSRKNKKQEAVSC